MCVILEANNEFTEVALECASAPRVLVHLRPAWSVSSLRVLKFLTGTRLPFLPKDQRRPGTEYGERSNCEVYLVHVDFIAPWETLLGIPIQNSACNVNRGTPRTYGFAAAPEITLFLGTTGRFLQSARSAARNIKIADLNLTPMSRSLLQLRKIWLQQSRDLDELYKKVHESFWLIRPRFRVSGDFLQSC